MDALSAKSARSLLEKLQRVKCFFAVIRAAPTVGAFTSLQSTMRLHNEEEGSFLDLWCISESVLMSTEGTPAVKAAVRRLANTLAPTSQTVAKLQHQLQANGSNERRQMLTIVEFLLRPLVGVGEDAVVLNKMEYSTVAPAGTKLDFLGISTENTWHGMPDCRCDIDVVNITMPSNESEESDEDVGSPGRKIPLEVKASSLTVKHLHQMVGNVVTYSFAHNRRHPHHNPFVPVLGLSGGQNLLMVALYDAVEDVLCYVQPHNWFNSFAACFNELGIFIVWLCLHHSLFLKRVGSRDVQSSLHDRFRQDEVLQHYQSLSRIDMSFWPTLCFEPSAAKKRKTDD